MAKNGKPAYDLTSFQLSLEGKKLLVGMAQERTRRAGRRVPMVSVLEEAIRLLAEREREANRA